MEQRIKETAEKVVTRMREQLGIDFGYDQKSIEWLDGYIERLRPTIMKDQFRELAAALGAYLGESIISTYGGEWHYFDKTKQWGIQFDEKNCIFPVSKVYKQLENGAQDSIISFFTSLSIIFKQNE